MDTSIPFYIDIYRHAVSQTITQVRPSTKTNVVNLLGTRHHPLLFWSHALLLATHRTVCVMSCFMDVIFSSYL